MGGFQKITGEHINYIRKLDKGIFSKYIVSGPCSKIYRLDFIRKHNLSFPVTNSSEDVYFNMNLLHCGAKVDNIRHIGYYYYNPTSLSNTLHK